MKKIKAKIKQLYNERKSFGDGSPAHRKIQDEIDRDIFKQKVKLKRLQGVA